MAQVTELHWFSCKQVVVAMLIVPRWNYSFFPENKLNICETRQFKKKSLNLLQSECCFLTYKGHNVFAHLFT